MTSPDPRDDLRRVIARAVAPWTGTNRWADREAADAAMRALDPMPAGWWCEADALVGVEHLHGEPCEPSHTADARLWVMRGVR